MKDCVNKTALVEIAIHVLGKLFKSGIELKMIIIFFCLVYFFWEKLILIQISKGARRYSSDLLTIAFLWKLTNTFLCKKLNNLLCFLQIEDEEEDATTFMC